MLVNIDQIGSIIGCERYR